MFKRITFIFVLALGAVSAQAQFSVDEDTLYAYGFAGKTSAEFVDIEAETMIRHTGSTPQRINWIRSENDLPSMDWSSAVCDIISCRSAEVDTGSFFFSPGDTGGLFFHFYTKNVNASGKMVVRFSSADNPLDYVDVVTFATAWKPVGLQSVNKNSKTVVTPNPAKNSITFVNDNISAGTIEFYNTVGQVVLTMPYNNEMSVDVSGLSSGVYTVKIASASQASFSKIIKE
jgi:hypothetical protein